MKDMIHLTDMELVVMRVLWEHEEAMTIQEIANDLKEEKISVQSVTQVMNRLVAKKAVVVKEHVLVSNVYARAFIVAITQQDILDAELKRLQKNIFGKSKLSKVGMVAALLSNDDGEISTEDMDEIQRIIDQKKKR